MNDIPTRDDNHDGCALMIDRLVDGELSKDEQRRLFEQLDDDPHGWRRLALAYVEAQTVRHACEEWVSPVVTTVSADTALPSSGKRGAVRIAIAAVVLLLAFGLGGYVGQRTSTPTLVDTSTVSPEITPEPVPLASPVEAVPVAWQYADGSMSAPVNTPVVDAASPIGQAWLNDSIHLSDRVREQLRRHGKKLQERQEWVEVNLADGRRGYMPVKEWTVSPVSLADFR